MFIHDICGYFSAWEASMIQRLLLMYSGITLESVFGKFNSTQYDYDNTYDTYPAIECFPAWHVRYMSK